MDVVGGGEALREPLGFALGGPRPEELRVVAEFGDQPGVALPEASLRQLRQAFDVGLEWRVALIHQFRAAG